MRKPLAIIVVALAVLALGASAAAQSQPAQNATPTVVTTNAKDVRTIEGAKLYDAYCASCHGRDGKGNGPAAKAMPTPVPDLTQLNAKNGGTDCFRPVLAEQHQGADAQPLDCEAPRGVGVSRCGVHHRKPPRRRFWKIADAAARLIKKVMRNNTLPMPKIAW